jgi:hypothetical protein
MKPRADKNRRPTATWQLSAKIDTLDCVNTPPLGFPAYRNRASVTKLPVTLTADFVGDMLNFRSPT